MQHRLSPNACAALRASVLRMEQHLAYLWVVEDHAGAIAVAQHCRAALHMCSEYGDPGKIADLMRVVPRVILFEARAQIARTLADERPAEALFHAERGLRDLLEHFSRHGTVRAYDRSREVRALERLHKRLVEQLFPGPRAELRQALKCAVRDERYEDAARIRNQLRGFGE